MSEPLKKQNDEAIDMDQPIGEVDPVTGDLIDPNTGEILPPPVSDVVLKDIPQVASWMRSARRNLEHMESPKQDCRCASCNFARVQQEILERGRKRRDTLAKLVDKYQERVRSLMEQEGQDKLEYPFGTFQFRTGRPSVDDTEYGELSDKEKAALHKKYGEDYFRTKTTVAPDKVAIMKALKDGESIKGFSIREPERKFVFKEEK